ncbi:hypothetical protein C8J56DRAFT_1045598 [Mycena floridula]|nr:hypothetical protein C8J56DRAFT_1045598 [Mycena floridula]
MTSWASWDMGVKTVLSPWGLLGHILDPQNGYSFITASYPPPPGYAYGTLEHQAWDEWWRKDGAVLAVLVAKLAPKSAAVLPQIDDIFQHSIPSCQIYSMLKDAHFFSTWADVICICNQLYNTVSGNSPKAILSFVRKWRSDVAAIRNANNPNSLVVYADFTKRFARLLPPGPLWQEARTYVYREANGGMVNQIVWETILKNVESDCMMLMNQHFTASLHNQTRQNTSTSRRPTVTGCQQVCIAVNGRYTCTNCSKQGHCTHICQMGKLRTGKNPVANIAIGVREGIDEQENQDNHEDYNDDPLYPVEHSQSTQVEQCVVVNSSKWTHLASFLSSNPIGELDPVTFTALCGRFQALLDCGCNTHLIQECEYFILYNPGLAQDVRMANCGVLKTEARGTA